MNKRTKITIAVLCLMAVAGVLIWQFTRPRTVAEITPGGISAFGKIDQIAPGNSHEVYVLAKNPSYLESAAIDIEYSRPDAPYEMWYNPWGGFDKKGKPKSRVVPSVFYEPAPPEAVNWIKLDTSPKSWYSHILSWFGLDTSENTAWGIVELLPMQEKALPFKINIPEDAVLPKRWYFRIMSRNASQDGFVATRAGCTVLVNMR